MLTVEDGTGKADAECYRTLAAHNAYHAKHRTAHNRRWAVPISTITRNLAVATATTSAPHGYTTGDLVYVTGAAEAEYNVVGVAVTVTSALAFTYAISGTPASPATVAVGLVLTSSLFSDVDKEAAIRQAARDLDGSYAWSFPGSRLTATQAREWPRGWATDRTGYAIATNVVPSVVGDAESELAARALAEELAPDAERGGAVQREKVGPLEVEYMDGASPGTSRPWIELILEPILAPAGALVRG